ncbi:MAG: hypothetical protein JKY01_10780 [Pseudomonadales bacterium]|nr:hypothetical protein [Pseudomonadales bacterium]
MITELSQVALVEMHMNEIILDIVIKRHIRPIAFRVFSGRIDATFVTRP